MTRDRYDIGPGPILHCLAFIYKSDQGLNCRAMPPKFWVTSTSIWLASDVSLAFWLDWSAIWLILTIFRCCTSITFVAFIVR